MREFLTEKNIAGEIKIVISPDILFSSNKKIETNSFFSKNIIKKRFKNIFNNNNFKLSSIN